MQAEQWMTPVARERLEKELVELEAAGEPTDVTTRARLIELRNLIRSADAATKPDDGLVEPGMTVTLEFARDGSTSTFLLGSRETSQLDPDVAIDVYSPTSPLGTAINGHRVGETITFLSPAGEQSVTIVGATPFS